MAGAEVRAFRRANRMAGLTSATLAAMLLGAGAQTTSKECRSGLDNMLRDSNWLLVNNSQVRWCRIILENDMSNCCSMEDFNRGIAENCNSCDTNCAYQGMIDMCNTYFGQACTVTRKPFPKAPGVKVQETFCVPNDCNNNGDKLALMAWYGTLYAGRRGGWTLNYDSAVLTCPGSAGQILTIIAIIVILALLAVPISIVLFVAPKERGRTLISQSDMNQDDDEDDSPNQDLRATASMKDRMGSSYDFTR